MSDALKRILVVEDETDLARMLAHNLRMAHFDVDVAPDGRTALNLARTTPPDLITLDLVLPDMSGIDVFRTLRGTPEGKSVPVIVVSARADEVDRVVLFELGADDYVTKPFSLRELVLRVQARLRRAEVPPRAAASSRLVFGVMELDPIAHRVFVNAQEIALTAIEFKLLVTLFNHRQRAQSRDQLLRALASTRSHQGVRAVDTHVKRLREKLGPAAGYVHTVRGIGYRFAEHPRDFAAVHPDD